MHVRFLPLVAARGHNDHARKRDCRMGAKRLLAAAINSKLRRISKKVNLWKIGRRGTGHAVARFHGNPIKRGQEIGAVPRASAPAKSERSGTALLCGSIAFQAN
jgi:hypothetical protein